MYQDSKGTVCKLTVHDSPPQNGISECGMQTQAELARALLIASGLTRFLWEEAMKHVAWIKNRSPHSALDGKSLYKMKHKKVPHLGSIHEFGTAAYVKDLKAGKLDACAKLRWFMGYNSKSKGFCIYWPNKWSVTVKCDVIFNQEDILTKSDHVIIPSDVLSEREKDKVIQHPEKTTKTNVKQPNQQIKQNSESQNLKIPKSSHNSIPFPLSKEFQQQVPDGLETGPVTEPNMGCGHRPHPAPGHYVRLNKGLEAKLATAEEPNGDDNTLPEGALFAAIGNMSVLLLTDFTLGSSMGTKLRTLDKALHTPCTKEWQNAYNYEIGQLTKLGTWDLVQLLAGKTLIPHSLVFKEKLGANGNINLWHVQLVTGGHRQTYGVDYDETFTMAAKILSIHMVLGNATQQDWEIHHGL